jgi:hypothetical protein
MSCGTQDGHQGRLTPPLARLACQGLWPDAQRPAHFARRVPPLAVRTSAELTAGVASLLRPWPAVQLLCLVGVINIEPSLGHKGQDLLLDRAT